MITPVIDLGGTIIKVGLVRDGRMIHASSMPANAHEGLAKQFPRIESAIRQSCEKSGVKLSACAGVGLAFPGIIDPRANRIISSPKDKYDDGATIDLNDWSQQTLGLLARVENDAHAALLGEWQFGSGRAVENLVMVTLGTGIGTSVLIGGRPLRGRHHQAGVLGGHLIVDPNGRPCICGARGCFEAQCGSWAIPEIVRAEPHFSSSELSRQPQIDYSTIFRLAGAGDSLALRMRDRALGWWGALLVTLIHSFDPERIVIGGGIMRSADIIIPHLQKFIDANAWTPCARVLAVPAALGDDAGGLGLHWLFTTKELDYV
ncbi:MAG: ROK family protein [Anaerolineae bacterium]|nr:ROK family protein [Phycisphaerae bacterium]